MSDNNNNEFDPYEIGLKATQNAAAILAKELRMMAAGEGPYICFFYASPWVRNIWNAAADFIEDHGQGRMH